MVVIVIVVITITIITFTGAFVPARADLKPGIAQITNGRYLTVFRDITLNITLKNGMQKEGSLSSSP